MAELRTLVDVHCWDYDRRIGVASGPVLAPAALVGSEVVFVERPDVPQRSEETDLLK